jgi:hypothetical protein
MDAELYEKDFYEWAMTNAELLKTIVDERRRITLLIEDSPSLRYEIESRLERAYVPALNKVEKETGIGKERFPESCPYTFDQAMDDDFWPE